MKTDLTTPEGIANHMYAQAKKYDSDKTVFASGMRLAWRETADAICRKNNIEIPK